MLHSKRAKQHQFGSGGGLEPMEKQILKYLHDHYTTPDASWPTRDIARGVGKKSKKEINRFLYSLQKRSLITKVTEAPPTWKLQRYDPNLGSNASQNLASTASQNLGSNAPQNHGLTSLQLLGKKETRIAASFNAPVITARTSTSEPARSSSSESSGEPSQPSDSVHKGHKNIKVNDEVPRTPQDFLNDVNSQFSGMSIKEKSSEVGQLETKILNIINISETMSTESIFKNIPGYTAEEINKAIEGLVHKNSILEVGGCYVSASHTEEIPVAVVAGTVRKQADDENTYPMCDFTTDNHSFDFHLFSPMTSHAAPSTSYAAPVPQPAQPVPQPLRLPDGKNAISVLNEYAQTRLLKIDYQGGMSGPDHKPSFWMTVTVGTQKFQGKEGSTKKDAKLKAAEAALSALYSSNKIKSPNITNPESATTSLQRESNIHNEIAALVNRKYDELAAQLPDMITGRKIIAGFVMSRKLKSGETVMQVVSMGSGNRCVMGDKLSLTGLTVNDCHAEIIARRGLVRYLYRELLGQKDDPMFVRYGDKFQLVPGIEFHLYISTAPCGDSAIFAPSDQNTDLPNQPGANGAHHPLFENKKQGLLRTKVENGEGCIPLEDDTSAPTWDGILRGERLRTMSCSDKIAKWNFLGLQGSLLSHFVEKPIYMSTLTLGMLYNHGHLTRAVCCRVQTAIDGLDRSVLPPSQYQINHPVVSGQNHNRETGKVKTREFSLNWCLGDDTPEVLDGTKGRCEPRFGSDGPSQLCKAGMFQLFKKLCEKTNQLNLYEDGYLCSKTAATDYQTAKLTLWNALEQNGYGKWMPKPKEEKDF